MAAPRSIEVRGLRELRRELRQIGPEWTKELSKVNKEVGDHAAEWARGGASSRGGVQRKAAYSIVGSGRVTGARVRWGGRGYEFADGAFFGSLKYKRFEPWIGNSWDVSLQSGEGPDKGPYGIGPAIGARTDDIADFYLEALSDLVKRVPGINDPAELG